MSAMQDHMKDQQGTNLSIWCREVLKAGGESLKTEVNMACSLPYS